MCFKALRPQSPLQASSCGALVKECDVVLTDKTTLATERLYTVLYQTVLFKIFTALYGTSNCIILFAKASHDTVS